ncbi:uncharacterized protein DS421_12g375050 [Arachis hypogaea]|nr:uncharacterized protein DS421_12g375050 [Arachis hypogaea]
MAIAETRGGREAKETTRTGSTTRDDEHEQEARIGTVSCDDDTNANDFPLE